MSSRRWAICSKGGGQDQAWQRGAGRSRSRGAGGGHGSPPDTPLAGSRQGPVVDRSNPARSRSPHRQGGGVSGPGWGGPSWPWQGHRSPRLGCREGLRRPESARQASPDRRGDQGHRTAVSSALPGTFPQSRPCRASQPWGQSGPVTVPWVRTAAGESRPRRAQCPAWAPALNPPWPPRTLRVPQSTLCPERSSWTGPVGPTYQSRAQITEGRTSEMCFWATPVPL